MELYESEQTSCGPYQLRYEGDQAYFSFQQDLRKKKNQKVGCSINLS